MEEDKYKRQNELASMIDAKIRELKSKQINIIYGDWRDDLVSLGIPIHMAESKYASPMCPIHGWISLHKIKINIWKCQCGFTITIDELIYREWRKKNANNLYSAVPPLKGSHCLTYKHPENPGKMELCNRCLDSFKRCLI